MKILYISDSSIPSYSANSIHVMKMCQAWARQGNEVTLIAKATTAGIAGVENVYNFYKTDPIFKLKIFPRVSFRGSGRFYNLLLPFFCFIKHDIAYTRAIYPAFWYSLFKKKIAFEIHEPFDSKNVWLYFLFNFIVKRGSVSKWIVISDALKKYLVGKFKIPSEQIIVAHDGADDVPADTLVRQLTGDVKIGYVGSLLKGKGIEIILPLSGLLPSHTFHIVGGANHEIEKWTKTIPPTQKNVFFHGFVPPSETTSFIASFDILIAPYLKEVFVKKKSNSNNIANWMSPLKIFEYMAAGKPIVTSDLPVLKEILTNNENALLCDPDNLTSWKNAIELVVNNKELARALGVNARTCFLKSFTWSSRAENILSMIRK